MCEEGVKINFDKSRRCRAYPRQPLSVTILRIVFLARMHAGVGCTEKWVSPYLKSDIFA